MSKDENQNADDWVPCPPGEVSGMVDRLQNRRNSVAVVRRIGAATAVLLCVAIWMAFPDSENNFGHITCSEVCKQSVGYKDGSIAKADPDLLARIEKHLDHCPNCAAKLRPIKTDTTASLDRAFGSQISARAATPKLDRSRNDVRNLITMAR
jgi:hypothetical protein